MKKILFTLIAGLLSSVIFAFDANSQKYISEPSNEDPTMVFPLFVLTGFDNNDISKMSGLLQYVDLDAFFIDGETYSEKAISELIDADRIDKGCIYVISNREPYSGNLNIAAQVVYKPKAQKYMAKAPSVFVVTNSDDVEELQKLLNVDVVIDVEDPDQLKEQLTGGTTYLLSVDRRKMPDCIFPVLEWLQEQVAAF